jgi:hypothetical protein
MAETVKSAVAVVGIDVGSSMIEPAERSVRRGFPPKSALKINIYSELAGSQSQAPTT